MRTIVGFVFSGAAAVLFVGGFLVCYLRSRGQYDEYMEYVEKEEYGLRDMIPLGLYLSEVLDGKSFLPLQAKAWLARRKNQVNQKILELRGPRNAEFYQYIHGGYRLTAALVMAAMASLMGLIFNFQGDVSNGILLSVLSVAAFLGAPRQGRSSL